MKAKLIGFIVVGAAIIGCSTESEQETPRGHLAIEDNLLSRSDCPVDSVIMEGTDGDDVLVADPNDPVGTTYCILGGPGDDTIIGGLGNDVLIGGGGFDKIFGDDGDDINRRRIRRRHALRRKRQRLHLRKQWQRLHRRRSR